MRKVYIWYMSGIYWAYVLYLAVGAAVVGTAPYRLSHQQ